MSLIVIGSAKGSPGATSFATALAGEIARRRPGGYPGAILIDGDGEGGDLGLRLGIDPVPGAATLALEGRHGITVDLLLCHAQRSPLLPGVAIVPGVAGAAQAAVLEWLATPLCLLATSLEVPVLFDAGRLPRSGHSLLEAADEVMLVCRPDTASLLHSRSSAMALSASGVSPSAVLLAEHVPEPRSFAEVLGCRVLGAVRTPCRRGEATLEALTTELMSSPVFGPRTPSIDAAGSAAESTELPSSPDRPESAAPGFIASALRSRSRRS